MKKYFLTSILLVGILSAAAQLPEIHWAKAFVSHNDNNPTVGTNGRSVAVDNKGNVYSAGLFTHTTDFDPGPGIFTLTANNSNERAIYISKLSPTGDFLWAIQIPTIVSSGNIEIKVDKENHVYIVSLLNLSTDFDPGVEEYILTPIGSVDAFVAKYDPNGNLVWAKQFGGPENSISASNVLAIDHNNDVIICGNFNSTVDFDPGPGTFNMTSTAHIQSFMVKLNTNGDFVWAKQFGNSPVVHSNSHIADVTCDLEGNIYTVGDFSGTCDFDPGPNNYLLKAGSLNNGFISKLNLNGDFIWAKKIGNTSNNPYQDIRSGGIALDAANNIYTVGSFHGTFDFDPGPNTHIVSSNSSIDWYLLKLNNQGEFEWVDVFGGDQNDSGADVGIDPDGNVYAIGFIGPTADMDPGSGEYNITTVYKSGTSAIVKVNSSGEFISAGTFDGSGGDDSGSSMARRIVLDSFRNIYITGSFGNIVDFDPGPGIYPVNSGIGGAPFVVKLARCKNITTSLLNINTCDSFILNNETFDSTGRYTQTILNSSGCDSIITLHLTINKKVTNQFKLICAGESFFAGGAYQTKSGVFKDTLKTMQNCDSIITTHLTVNPKPFPNLGPNGDLCAGTQSNLNPGSFTDYLWQDNTTANLFSVNNPGVYWVKVTNEFNCSAADTISIRSILPAPDNFLKKTDSICSYQKIALKTSDIFHEYLWSTGSIEKDIIIEKSGKYSLEVTDANGCIGTNKITVYQKDCKTAVYIPTAFSPNNDGLNDVFKAQVFGNLTSFNLQVFGRQGQVIFQTADPLKGWNGSYRGSTFSTSYFVWQCSYQFADQKADYQKGRVLIIR